MKRSGFTLVELIVAAAIGMLLLGLVLQTMIVSRKAADLSTMQSTNLDSLNITASILGDDVRRADIIQPSFAAPAWLNIAKTNVIQALSLRTPKNLECSSTYEISYYVVPRTALTGIADEWVKVKEDSLNTSTRTMLRAINCNSTVTTRLVADYLDNPEFAIAFIGQSDYETSPTINTGGDPYLSVRTKLARSITTSKGTIREPAGTDFVINIATSRATDTDTTPLP